jgi:hypothetical protein
MARHAREVRLGVAGGVLLEHIPGRSVLDGRTQHLRRQPLSVVTDKEIRLELFAVIERRVWTALDDPRGYIFKRT